MLLTHSLIQLCKVLHQCTQLTVVQPDTVFDALIQHDGTGHGISVATHLLATFGTADRFVQVDLGELVGHQALRQRSLLEFAERVVRDLG